MGLHSAKKKRTRSEPCHVQQEYYVELVNFKTVVLFEKLQDTVLA